MTGQGKDVETETGAIKAARKALPVAKKALPVALFAIVVLAVGALLAASGVTGAGGRRAPVLASVAPAPGAPPASAGAPNGRLLPAALVSRRPALTPASAPAHFLPDQYRQGQVLVGFRSGVSAAQRSAIARAVGAYGARQLGPTIKPAGRGRVRGQQFIAPFEFRVPTSVPVLSIARRLRLNKAVAYAEPNYLESGDAAPNDESFPLQWGSSNTGQAIPTQSAEEVLGAPVNGTVGADDKALKAWKVTTGSPSIVIGEVDTGIALTHPDLAANIWSNPGNVFKAQKCAAGTHGFNVLSKNCNPEDEDETYNGHGTHVAGIMGGVGNNGIGVAGMNWQTTILPVKWMHNAAGGETSALIEALQFEVLAKQEGVNVRVVNDSDSFFGTTKSEALENEIEVLGANNILFVTSAGNTGNNNDEVAVQRYPCSYDKPNEICVTASNNKDELPSWANTGSHTVQLAAPGVSIFSTFRGNTYGYLSGGSMASPQVAGAAALILSVAPSLTVEQLKSDILKNVDELPSLKGKLITGGRLDVCKALPGCEHEITKVPSLEVAPKITGSATSGQTLTASTGEWTEEPLAYSYQWKRCNGRSEEASCAAISGATAQTYKTGSEDVGKTLRIVVTATNTKGSSAPASSETVGPLKPAELTCGKTSVGGTVEALASERKRVNLCTLATAQPVQKLMIYLQPSGTSGQELFEGVVYAEASGTPGALLGTTSPLTFKSTNAAGWYELTFATPLNLAAGNYWIGFITGPATNVADFRFDAGTRKYNTNAYASGPSNPFASSGKVETDTKQASLYAADVPLGRPVNTGLPTVSGTFQSRQTLTATKGTWVESPTEFAYQWQRCNTLGEACKNIEGATASTYTAGPADVGSTLRAGVNATNATGSSTPEAPCSSAACSKQTAVVAAATPALVEGKGPAISGKAEDEQTLTAETGAWTESPTEYAYQWQRCSGETCKAIEKATASSYKLTPGDVGSALRVEVTAKNAVGPSLPAVSPQTALVAPAPPSVVEGKAPTISGKAEDGKPLTAENGTWKGTPAITFAYQWQSCNISGELCKNVEGAISPTYSLGHSDVGATLKVIVTAKNAGGEVSATSAKTPVVLAAPPHAESPLPEVAGKAEDGETLGSSSGAWGGTPPFSFSYQWQRCNNLGEGCKNIEGATNSTYGLGHGDVGTTLQVMVTAKNAGGEATAVSKRTGVVAALPPSLVEGLKISGKPEDEQTLIAETGTWKGTPPITFAYQWQRCNTSGEACKAIEGATASTYKLTPADVGSTVKVVVTAKNAAGTTPASSPASATILPALPSPVEGKPGPAISGEAKDGKLLTAENGTWKGTPTITFAYQWLSCSSLGEACSPIPGANSPSYRLKTTEVKTTLRVMVTAKNAGGEASATSAPTPIVVAAAPKLTGELPGILGKPEDEQTLSASSGSWEGTLPITFAYQWQRCAGASCSNIEGETSSIYAVGHGDVGSKLQIIVKAKNEGGEATSVSEKTAVVLASAPVNKVLPSISGTAKDGETLKAEPGSWEGTPTITYSYQWQSCNGSGEACKPIEGATASTYKLLAGDVGATLKVIVTAKNGGGETPAASPKSAVVGASAPVNKVLPSISGTAKDGETLKAEPGSWEGTPTITYSYQWQSCNGSGEACKPIEGATASTYKLLAGDVGATLKVIVTAKNGGGETPAASPKSAVVGASAPVNKVLPSISGTAKDGETLKAEPGSWEGTPTITYSYQWQSCNGSGEACKPIEGATASTYKLLAGDVGATLKVIVTAKNGGGETPAASPKSAVVGASAPVNKVLPSISGTAKDGETLKAEPGSWEGTPTITYSYQWQSCNGSGEACKPIEGATASTYKLLAGDVGATLKVIVTAKNGGGETPAASPKSAVVGASAPVNKVLPSISGTAKDGETLKAEPGSWEGTPTITYSYQWQSCNGSGEACKPIEGATASTYKLLAGDVGATLKVIVTAKNGGGETPAASPKSAVVGASAPVNKVLPSISGTAKDGETLKAEPGSWEGTPTITYSYQWQSCNGSGEACKPIEGATASTYKLLAGDVGATLKVIVTAKNGGGETPAASPKSAVVGASAPVNKVLPSISGTAKDGETLKAEPGSWEGTPTITYSYQWQSCNGSGEACKPIEGATASTYKLLAGDVGATLKVIVTAKNGGGETPAASPKSAVVGASAPVNKVLPSISGTAKDGETLKAEPGSWEGTPTITYSYQWQSCNGSGEACKPIEGATASTYKLLAGDVGATLKVIVTAKNGGGETPAASPKSAVVGASAPVNKVLPSISGTAKDGETLKAEPGSWEGTPTITYSYQWQSCNGSGEACKPIEGATASTYKLLAGDVGATLKVIVTAKNGGGETPAASPKSAVVGASAPVNKVLPSISGTAKDGETLKAEPGSWEGTPTITYSYQWQSCNGSGEACKPIEGATASTYKLLAGDVGATLKVIVTAKNGGGETPAASPKSAVVGASAPVNKVLPSISGTAKDGETLKAEPGSWEGTPTITYSYQWQSCNGSGEACKPIEGATASTYKLSSGEVGSTLKITVTAKNTSGTTPATSPASAVVLAAGPTVVEGKGPSISGTAKDGETLKAEPGSWEGTPTITYSYQWQSCNSLGASCSNVEGATEAAYLLGPGDVNTILQVVVTAKNAGGTASSTSTQTADVLPLAPTKVTAPAIKGSAQDLQTLTAENGTWTESPTGFSYQWQRCDESGNNCKAIEKATASTYKLTPADVGFTLRVEVTASNAGGSSAPESSAQTAVVLAAGPTVVEGKGPSISGTAKDGQTLKAENGSWEGTPTITYSYQWQLCNGSGEACEPIEGATASTYKLSSGEVGSTLKITVTAKNTSGTTPATSPASAVVLAAGPTVVEGKGPSISGTAKKGQTLKAEDGTWTGTPTITFAYQWQRCNSLGASCSNVEGATEAAYLLGPGDVNTILQVVVTAKNAGGTASSTSTQTADVLPLAPTKVTAPAIKGSAQDLQTLTAENGTWTESPTGFSYQWQRCDESGNNCKAIEKATASTYKLTPADVGFTLRVEVTASNAGGSSAPESSAQTAVVLAAGPTVVEGKGPSISGTAKKGQTLKAEPGSWEGTPTITYSYQWQSCNSLGASCSNVEGATEAAYLLGPGDVNTILQVVVTAKNAGGTASSTSTQTADVLPLAPTKVTAPAIKGSAQDLQTLTAENGTWTESPTGFSYQWQRCDESGNNCKAIEKATASTYKLTPADVGFTLRVEVTASNAGGSSAPESSAQTAVVLAAGPTVVEGKGPSISGTAKDGQTLKAENGSWEGTPTITYSYQWQLCNGSGEACEPIEGATASTYKLSSGEVGSTLKITVTAKNTSGTTPATSPASAVVLAAGPTVVEGKGPSISGTAKKGQTLKAEDGTWTGTPTITFAYQWQRCNSLGASCSNVEGATEAAYLLGPGDVNTILQVVVTAKNAGGTASSTSTQTADVLPLAPTKVTAPAIKGSAQDLQTLTAENGTWTESPTGFSYQWQRCDESGNNCKAIEKATASTYKLTPADVGFTLRVEVTASNAGGSSAPESSAQTAVVVSGAPVNKVLPSISGTAKDGETLKAEPGSWEGTPTITYSYQWQSCNGSGEACKPIEGATASTYKLLAGDVGATLKVIVTAKNGGGETPAASPKSAVVGASAPVNKVLPSISGTAKDGETLKAEPGSWEGTPTITYSYQWQSCNGSGEACKPIEGATASTYKLLAGDVGATLKVIVTAKNGGGETPAASPKSAVVGASAPVNKVLPSISGTAKDGETLKAEPGSWEGTPTITYSYQWQSCNGSGEACKPIEGATASTYKLLAGDVGATLKVIVTAKNGGGETPAASPKSAVVGASAPVNKVLPSISGTAKDGETLKAEPGSWEGTPTITYSYQWQSCNGSGEACKPIEGATASTYKLLAGDVGATLKVIVTAKNGGGETPAASPKSAVVGASAPVNKVLPSISGTAKDGETLKAEPGSWEGTPTITYSYQWQSCNGSGEACKPIEGATASTYKLLAGDVGATLKVIVTAKNGGGETPAASPKSAVVGASAPVNKVLPSISGTAKDGETLKAEPGSWEGTPTITYSYQWQSCNGSGEACKPIEGATASTYKLLAGDVGATLKVIVTAKNGGGETPAASPKSAVVGASAPVNKVLPSISGTAKDGETLKAEPGSWEGTPTITYSYQWQSCNGSGEACKPIEGATASTYKLLAGDVGATLKVIVTAKNGGGETPAASPKSAVVGASAPVNKVLPSISGTAKDGETLKAEPGSWEGTPTITYSYQWQSCNGSGEACKPIEGATASTYKLLAGDVGATLKVIVTAKNGGGETPAASPKSAVVGASAPVNKVLPSISGTAKDGETLKAEPGSWEGTPTITYSYQWQSCNGSGEACKPIEGATASTYKLLAGDVGATLKVIVTAKNGGGETPAASPKSAVVGASAPVNKVLPSISGTAKDGETLKAEPGSWEGTPTITYSYQWQSCNGSGEACKPIEGATASTYKLLAGDVGATLKVIVTAKNGGGETPAASPKSAQVQPALPVNKGLPTISGEGRSGQSLKASTGEWTGTPTITYSYQWQRCNSSGEACKAIEGATASTYKLLAGDVGSTVRITVTASNSAGSSAPVTSTQAVLIRTSIPVNITLPASSGTAQSGQSLKATTGEWTESPTAYTYQWQRCDSAGANCTSISGATAQTYTAVAADVGSTLRVAVTASNTAGPSVPAISAQTPLVKRSIPVEEALPTITGTAQSGQSLTASTGSWTESPTAYAYQWQRCDAKGANCSAISGATAQTYLIGTPDVGSTLRVTVTASNSAGPSAPATSEQGAFVLPGPPVDITSPTIVGTAKVGQSLSSTTGTWAEGATAYAYQWQRCDSTGANCSVIPLATTSTYVVGSPDAGSTLRVAVTASNAVGPSAPASSPQTLVVAPNAAPANTVLPAITGTVKSGQTLTATTGTWTEGPTGFAYQWQRCDSTGAKCAAISLATAQTYVAGSPDVGSTLRVAVTASNAVGPSAPASSAQTVIVAPNAVPVNTVLPGISGTAQSGQTLTAGTGSWTEGPTGFAYQWQRCDAKGANCTAISLATAQTYSVASADVGSTLRVAVTASNAVGPSAPASSVQTGVVTAPASLTFGKTSVGASADSFAANRKRVNRYALPSAGSVTKLSIYLAPNGVAGQQLIEGVVYSDSGGAPNALLGTSTPLTFLSTNTAGWYDLTFTTPLNLAAGNYWIGVITGATANVAGFRYDSVTNSRDVSTNTYTSGPTNPFGAVTTDSEQMSLYATFTESAPAPTAPVNTAPPTITGSAQKGQTLTAGTGSWTESPTTFAYQWQRCDAKGANCSAISLATTQTYVAGSPDVGSTLRVAVTASNAVGPSAPASSAQTVVVAPNAVPVNTVLPGISGTAQSGQTLTATTGTWTEGPTTYAYQWQRCDAKGANCTAISLATAQTYSVGSADVGSTLRVAVTASNAVGPSAPASSAQTVVVPSGAAPANTVLPTISGTVKSGQTLTAGTGSWTEGPTGFAYQWQRCDAKGANCTSISLATAQTYSVASADVGSTLRVAVTASNAVGPSAPASSAQTVVVAPNAVPVNTVLPGISGTAQSGQTLTAGTGSWTEGPTGFAYQWQRCDAKGANCTAISLATAQTYSVASADVGSTLRVAVTASNAVGPSAPASSVQTVVVPSGSAPANTVLPAITGTVKSGQTLTATTGTWTEGPTGFAYQWQRCDSTGAKCAAISLATAQTYVAGSPDVGSTLRVAVTASNAVGPSAPASSAQTVIVAPNAVPVNTVLPGVSGTAQSGQTLTATTGTWTEGPTTYAYQWQRCDATGANCTAISLATAQTYSVASADIGSTLRVAVTASNAVGPSAPASSVQTGVVTAPASLTFGKTSVGASADSFAANRKRVNRYALPSAGSVTKLSIYLAPNGVAGQQLIEGVVYSDSGGAPNALLGTSTPLTFLSTNTAGWYDLTFTTPLNLAAGNYWIGVITGATANVAGFRYDSVTNSRDVSTNTYTSGPTNPFGAVTTDSEQMSLYATYH